MANINRTNQDRDVVVAGIEFTYQASGGFITSGAQGFFAMSGVLYQRTPGGAFSTVGGGELISVPVVLSTLVSGSVAARISPDFACRAIALDYQGVQSFGTSGSATFQLGIQGNSCSGGVVTVVTGNSAVGTRTAGTAVTGANSVGTSGEITVTMAANLSGVIGAGQGMLVIKLGPPV